VPPMTYDKPYNEISSLWQHIFELESHDY